MCDTMPNMIVKSDTEMSGDMKMTTTTRITKVTIKE
jgi:hypothetical protein